MHTSMIGKGNCYGNAVAESFFATLKRELIHRTVFLSRSQAYQEVFAFLDMRCIRCHSRGVNIKAT